MERGYIALTAMELGMASPGLKAVYIDSLVKKSKPTVQLELKWENLVGIGSVPTFELCSPSMAFRGKSSKVMVMMKGGREVHAAKHIFLENILIQCLLPLASLKATLSVLLGAQGTLSRRVNALDKVLLPKLSKTILYVQGELEEVDRDDFYRMKLSTRKKNAKSSHE